MTVHCFQPINLISTRLSFILNRVELKHENFHLLRRLQLCLLGIRSNLIDDKKKSLARSACVCVCVYRTKKKRERLQNEEKRQIETCLSSITTDMTFEKKSMQIHRHIQSTRFCHGFSLSLALVIFFTFVNGSLDEEDED